MEIFFIVFIALLFIYLLLMSGIGYCVDGWKGVIEALKQSLMPWKYL